MKPFPLLLLVSLLATEIVSFGQTVSTDPVGFIPITAKGNSDTFLSVPLHRSPVFQGTVASASNNTLTVSGATFATDAYKDTHFVLIASGNKEGMWYTITGNSPTTLNLDLAGDTLGSAVTNGTIIRIIPFWTLDTLFPSGAGIKASSTFFAQTLILFPDQTRAGITLAPTDSFFYYSGSLFGGAGWRKFGANPTQLFNNERLLPDSYLIVRHQAAGDTTITIPGAVQMTRLANALVTLAPGTAQDNALAFNVAVPTSLAASQLYQSQAFAGSSTIDVPADQLLVYDNATAQQNKQPAAIYYYYTGQSYGGPGWRLKGDLNTLQDNTLVFQPGAGCILRKAANAQPVSALWTFRPSYVPQ